MAYDPKTDPAEYIRSAIFMHVMQEDIRDYVSSMKFNHVIFIPAIAQLLLTAKSKVDKYTARWNLPTRDCIDMHNVGVYTRRYDALEKIQAMML